MNRLRAGRGERPLLAFANEQRGACHITMVMRRCSVRGLLPRHFVQRAADLRVRVLGEKSKPSGAEAIKLDRRTEDLAISGGTCRSRDSLNLRGSAIRGAQRSTNALRNSSHAADGDSSGIT